MRTFHLHPIAAAIIFSILIMGVLGTFVLMPIICINWVWNTVVAGHTSLPDITIWQAGLLYLASACIVYLSGLIRIEIKTEMPD